MEYNGGYKSANEEELRNFFPKKRLQNTKELIKYNCDVFDRARKATKNGIVTVIARGNGAKGVNFYFEVIDANTVKLGHYLDDVTERELNNCYLSYKGLHDPRIITPEVDKEIEEYKERMKRYPCEVREQQKGFNCYDPVKNFFLDDPKGYRALEFIMRYGRIEMVIAEYYIPEKEAHDIRYFREADRMLAEKPRTDKEFNAIMESLDFDNGAYWRGANLLAAPEPLMTHPERLTRPLLFFNRLAWRYDTVTTTLDYDYETRTFKTKTFEIIEVGDPIDREVEKVEYERLEREARGFWDYYNEHVANIYPPLEEKKPPKQSRWERFKDFLI